MAEQEELKLIVSLTDNASAGLAKLRSEMDKLGGGQGGKGPGTKFKEDFENFGNGSMRDNLSKMQRAIEQLTKGSLKPLSETVGGLSPQLALMVRGLGVAGAGLVAVATAAYFAHSKMSEFADSMRRWGQLANSTGFGVANMKQMAAQMRESGLSAEQIDRTLNGLSSSMARFARDQRRFRGEILSKTPDDQKAAMSALLGELAPLVNDPDLFANKIKEIGERIKNQKAGPIRGAQAQQTWLDFFHTPDLKDVRGNFTKPTQDQIDLQNKMLEQGREYDAIMGRIAKNSERLRDAFGSMAFGQLKGVLEWFDRSFKAFTDWYEGHAAKQLEPGAPAGPPNISPNNSDTLNELRRKQGLPPLRMNFQGGETNTEGTVRLISLTNQVEGETKQAEKLTEQLTIMNSLFNRLFPQGAGTNGAGGGPIGGGFMNAAYHPGGGDGGGNAFGGSRTSVSGGNRGRTADDATESVTDSSNPNLSGNEFLASQRARFKQELENNPEQKKRLAAIVDLENPGAGPAVAESLMNRMAMSGRTLASGMGGGARSFYGPVRRGLDVSRQRELERNPRRMANLLRNIDLALAGSNVTQGHTDQGSAGDPNYYAGGTGVNINRERFNDWGGYRGVAYSRAWRLAQQERVNAARNTVDRSGNGSTVNHNVTGTGNLRVDVNGPPGTSVTGQVSGLFKQLEVIRNVQMQKADTGAPDQ